MKIVHYVASLLEPMSYSLKIVLFLPVTDLMKNDDVPHLYFLHLLNSLKTKVTALIF